MLPCFDHLLQQIAAAVLRFQPEIVKVSSGTC